jgi:peroxiredoxin
MAGQPFQNIVQALDDARTQSGQRLAALYGASPVLLLFLRHAGCAFCREALGDVARDRDAIEAAGVRIVLVHMGDSGAIGKLISKHGLGGVDRICDPERKLYQAFGLKRGRLRQLFGPKVLWRAFPEGALWRHGIGRLAADSFQMPGLFLIDESGILRRFRHRTAADRPDYAGICMVPVQSRGDW